MNRFMTPATLLAMLALAVPASATPRIVLLRSVTAAIEVEAGLPRLVLIARGPSAESAPVELRHEVDPSRCSLARQPYRQEQEPGSPRQLRWYHILWTDGGKSRVIGSALAIRDEMPGPGTTPRYELLELPRADYGFDVETQTFRFSVVEREAL